MSEAPSEPRRWAALGRKQKVGGEAELARCSSGCGRQTFEFDSAEERHVFICLYPSFGLSHRQSNIGSYGGEGGSQISGEQDILIPPTFTEHADVADQRALLERSFGECERCCL